MLVDLCARRLGGDAQCLRELAVIDLMILRGEQRAGDLAGKARLAGARCRSRKPFERQIEAALNSKWCAIVA